MVRITLSCEGEGCSAEFGPRWGTLAEVRKLAAGEGWTRTRGQLRRNPRFDDDWCPDHNPREKP